MNQPCSYVTVDFLIPTLLPTFATDIANDTKAICGKSIVDVQNINCRNAVIGADPFKRHVSIEEECD